jgi:hypothetical protein
MTQVWRGLITYGIGQDLVIRGGLPLFTESPRRGLLGNRASYVGILRTRRPEPPSPPVRDPRPLSSDVLAIDRSIPRRHYSIRLIDGSGAWVSYERVRLCFHSVRLQRLSLS